MSELLVVGGFTVDRFGDGRSAAGGSVFHCGIAAVAEGVRPGFLTVAGPEPEAREGLRRLGAHGQIVHQPARATTTYRHDESSGRRVLVYEAAGEPIHAASAAGLPSPRVALLAPIADELAPATVDAITATLRPQWVVLLIQGWLRRLELGAAVHPMPLEDVDPSCWATFATADAVVVSTEDLAETPNDPFAQAAAVRARIGSKPILLLTLGTEGYLLDDPGADRVVAAVPRRVVTGVPTVGAGDTFGAALALHLRRGADPMAAADAASGRVIETLEGRRHAAAK